MAYSVSVENTFSGPMDLLLFLVKRDEIDIHDIPIAHLTREYMNEIERLQQLDMDLAADFMAVASMLVEIKSRMLLPPSEEEEDGEDEDLDPRAGLVQALLEYKRFKEIAAALGEMAEDHARRFARFAPPRALPEDEPTINDAGVMDLFAAFQAMVQTMLAHEAQEIVNDEIPTEQRILQVEQAVAAQKRVAFSSLLSVKPTKGEMVGFFIAIMELIRLRKIRARQSVDWSEIFVETRDDEPVPRGAAQPLRLPAAMAGLGFLHLKRGRAIRPVRSGGIDRGVRKVFAILFPTGKKRREDGRFSVMPFALFPAMTGAVGQRRCFDTRAARGFLSLSLPVGIGRARLSVPVRKLPGAATADEEAVVRPRQDTGRISLPRGTNPAAALFTPAKKRIATTAKPRARAVDPLAAFATVTVKPAPRVAIPKLF